MTYKIIAVSKEKITNSFASIGVIIIALGVNLFNLHYHVG